jgi:hypothetical protein
MTADFIYQENLNNLIIALLSNEALDFISILKRCQGAYPTSVQLTLDRLVAIEKVSKEHDVYYITNLPASQQQVIRIEDDSSHIQFNSIPHSADYDWRFTPNSVDTILKYVKEKYQANDKIGLFGVTSLFQGLVDTGFDTQLFNKSEYLISEIKSQGYAKGLIKHDLFFPIENFRQHFDLIIADPPWYVDFYSAFLQRASESLKNNGEMFLSIFPKLTRPEAIQERKVITDTASNLGFELIATTERYFNYSTPRFEMLSLKAEGIMLNADWRTGDLFIFKKSGPPKQDFQNFEVSQEHWDDFVWHGKRIKVRLRSEFKLTDFTFDLVGDTSILKTVSRRFNKRDKIDLWTSDNEAYSIRGIFILKEALSLLEKNLTIEETILTLQSQYPSLKGFFDLKKLLEQL